ncbi:MAG: outer membrane protein assembly factor BamD [Ignavibacteriae bacterium]|nr:MAG: outer membrane protein assembly factor BamD [Ignavibacteriota bacterium]
MKHSILIFALLFPLAAPVRAQDSKENADFKLAVNLYRDKLYDLALEQLSAFINLYPNTAQGVEARFYLGLVQSKLGKHDEARFTFQNFALAYADNNKAPEAWMNAAEEYAAMKNEREAAMAFERVKTFHPKSKFAPMALSKAAEYYNRLGDRENEMRVLRLLTQEYTTDEVLPARLRTAELLNAEDQFEQARQECKRVVDATNNASLKARALFTMGQSLIGLGRSADAEDALSEVAKNFKSTSSYYDALFMLGVLKNLAGNTDGAIAAWKSLAEDSVKAPKQLRQDAYIEMAEANNHVRSFPRALFLFERAAEIRGVRNGEVLYNAGVAAEQSGDTAKAAKYYSRALTDSLGQADRRALIIGAYRAAKTTKNYAEAVRLVNDYRRQYSSDSNLPHLLVDGAGIASSELNDQKTAIEYCEWVLQNSQTSEWIDDATFALGEARMKSGDADGAIEAFDNLQRRYPSSEFVPEAQKKIRFINAFDQRSRDASLQKLALLVGDVIAQKSKGNLAYRLADIYFFDLKDYQLAATQYAYALTLDLEESLQSSAWSKQAQSNELLALREGNSSKKGKEYLSNAIALYDSTVSHFPAGEIADQAVVTAFMLRLQSAGKPEDLRALGTEFLSKSTGASGKDAALLLLGDSYLSAKKYENAILTYKLLLEKYPTRESAPSARFHLGMALDGMMDKDSAVLVIDRFLADTPNHLYSAAAAAYLAKAAADSAQLTKALVFFGMLEKRYYYSPLNSTCDIQKADAYFIAKDYKNAMEWYEQGWKRMQSDFFAAAGNPNLERSIIFHMGVCCEKLGDRASAKKYYADYVTRDQVSERAGQAYYALASIAKEENNVEAATAYLQNVSRIAAKSGGQSASVALETAELLFRNEKYSDALSKFNEALTRADKDSLKQYILSRIVISYYRLDNLQEADKRAVEFVKGNNAGAYNEAAEFEFERGTYQVRKKELVKAKERFDNVVQSYRKSRIVPEALFWIARVYELDQKMPQAVQVYDSLVRNYPNSDILPRARLSLGNAYYNLEQWDNASKQYRFILDNEQRSPDLVPLAMSNLIMTYKEMELFDGALELTRKYIDRYPNETDLIDKKIDMGVLYQKLGYYDQSVLQLQSLIEAGNSDLEAELRYYIGEAYYYKGELQQAVLEFLKVPYLVTQRGKIDWISTAYYMAGQSYEKMSKYDQAMTMYKQIIDRKDTDVQFKTAAQKEIDRVKGILKK